MEGLQIKNLKDSLRWLFVAEICRSCFRSGVGVVNLQKRILKINIMLIIQLDIVPSKLSSPMIAHSANVSSPLPLT